VSCTFEIDIAINCSSAENQGGNVVTIVNEGSGFGQTLMAQERATLERAWTRGSGTSTSSGMWHFSGPPSAL
jgi:hypothetical protein